MNYKCQTYVRKGRDTTEVDREYFSIIQKDSELYEYLVTHGVEQWDGYKDAEQEYNNDKDV